MFLLTKVMYSTYTVDNKSHPGLVIQDWHLAGPQLKAKWSYLARGWPLQLIIELFHQGFGVCYPFDAKFQSKGETLFSFMQLI